MRISIEEIKKIIREELIRENEEQRVQSKWRATRSTARKAGDVAGKSAALGSALEGVDVKDARSISDAILAVVVNPLLEKGADEGVIKKAFSFALRDALGQVKRV